MKTIFRTLLNIIYIPFILLAGILAIIRLLYSLFIVFTLDISKEWSNKMLIWVSDIMNKEIEKL